MSSLRTLELVLAFLVQSLLTGVSPSLSSCLGGGAILSGVLLLAAEHNIFLVTRKFAGVLKEQFRNYWQQEDGEESRLLPEQTNATQ